MKRPGVLLLPPGWDAIPSQGSPPNPPAPSLPPPPSISQGFPDNLPAHIYIPGWREAL